MKRNRRRRNSRGEMVLKNVNGMHEDGEDGMKMIPETPDIEVARSPPTMEKWAGPDGPGDDGTPCQQPSKHKRAQGSKSEAGKIADTEKQEAVVRESQQAQEVPAKRRQRSLVPFQVTLDNRRRFETTMRRGYLKAAENNTPLPQWLQRYKATCLGLDFVRLRAELLAPERDQAKISRMLADLAGPKQQAANQESGAEVPEPGARGAEQEAEAAAQTTGEPRSPAKGPVGGEL